VHGLIAFPRSQAAAVLHGYSEIISTAPDELSARAGEVPGPDGNPVVIPMPVWTGAQGDGEKYIAEFQTLGTPLATKVAPMSFCEPRQPVGCTNRERSQLFTSLTLDGRSQPKPFPPLSLPQDSEPHRTPSFVFHHLHGPATRVAPDATAFSLRRKHYIPEIGAAWDPGSDSDAARHREWANDFSAALAPFALPGGYANFLTPDDHEQVKSAYGNNARRLRDLKRKFDPDNIFFVRHTADVAYVYA
jgi:hypothetical protein